MTQCITGTEAQLTVHQLVSRLWCEVLRVPVVTDDDNFFGLGGHSLSALRVIGLTEQALGIELGGMREMCENPTLAGFVALVSTRHGDPATQQAAMPWPEPAGITSLATRPAPGPLVPLTTAE
ncbi:MAG TPA: phosphopantetheine-binding protein [Streptosporangiaceae bacterium]